EVPKSADKPRRRSRQRALAVIQPSDSALRIHPYLHTLALDGVYARDAESTLVFGPLPVPSAEAVPASTHAGIVRVLERAAARSRAPTRRPAKARARRPCSRPAAPPPRVSLVASWN